MDTISHIDIGSALGFGLGKKASSQKLPKRVLDGIVALTDGSHLVSSGEGAANRMLVRLSLDSSVETKAAPPGVAAARS